MPDIEEVVDRVSMAVGNALSALLAVTMIGDLLGVNVFELARQLVLRPWVIPVEWIVMYYPLWYGMQWALTILVLADVVYTNRYYSTARRMPPASYVKWVSLAIFLLSFWLALLFRKVTFIFLAVYSSISFSYAAFVRRE